MWIEIVVSLPNRDVLVLFSFLLLWLEATVQCWIEVQRAEIFILSLISYGENIWLSNLAMMLAVGFGELHLPDRGNPFLFIIVDFLYQEEGLDLSMFFYIYWNNQELFDMYSIDEIYFIHWFLDDKPTLHPGIDPTLSWYIIIFYILLDLVTNLLRIFDLY